MPIPLTDLERRVLAYLVEYLRRNTYQPSIREIGREFTIKSTKTVSELLQSLADKGWIERDPSRSRGVRLLGLDATPDTVTVPLLYAAAGAAEEYVLDRRLAGAVGGFFIVMEGTHLVAQGIRDGDLLLIEPVTAANVQSEELVLVRGESGTSVRRCTAAGAELILEPAGPATEPLSLTQRQAVSAVQGRVTGVVRRLSVSPVRAPADSLSTT